MIDKFDPVEHAKMIYQARPDSFTAAAYQTVLKLERLHREAEEGLRETKILWDGAQAAYKEAMAEKAKYAWHPVETAPSECPVLATWITDDGRRVTGQVWKQLGVPNVDSDLEDAMGMPRMMTYWSFDYEGEDILHIDPTHWMALPEGPVQELPEEPEDHQEEENPNE
jgi:hypothetical protein